MDLLTNVLTNDRYIYLIIYCVLIIASGLPLLIIPSNQSLVTCVFLCFVETPMNLIGPLNIILIQCAKMLIFFY